MNQSDCIQFHEEGILWASCDKKKKKKGAKLHTKPLLYHVNIDTEANLNRNLQTQFKV